MLSQFFSILSKDVCVNSVFNLFFEIKAACVSLMFLNVSDRHVSYKKITCIVQSAIAMLQVFRLLNVNVVLLYEIKLPHSVHSIT